VRRRPFRAGVAGASRRRVARLGRFRCVCVGCHRVCRPAAHLVWPRVPSCYPAISD